MQHIVNMDQVMHLLKAEAGKCVIWPSGWTHMHRGIVAPDETKYITTGWFSYVISEEKNQTGS